MIAAGAAGVVGLEVLRGGDTTGASAGWLLAETIVATAALLLAWTAQSDVRLIPLLVVIGGFQLALVALHLHLGISGDVDVREVYRSQGNSLLDGTYPRSDYPPGAVVLFAADALLGGGPTRAAHAFLMIPFILIAVAAIWSLRTGTSAWLAALFGLLPGELYFWEYRFDLVPAACLAVGLAVALRRAWPAAAAALAVGAWVKWLPALAAGGLWLWLARLPSRRAKAAVFAAVFAGALLVLHLPFLVWDAGNVLAAYTGQGGRGITAESLPYLPLRATGLAHLAKSGYFWDESVHPGWADVLAVCVQVALVAAAAVAAARCRSREGAVAAAALVPAVFALTNRVFSPQFTVLIVVAWLVAGALLCRTRGEQLALGAVVMVAGTANALVYPARIESWLLASAAFFAVSLALTAALLVAAARRAGPGDA
jgi:hypothetical protein